MAVDILTAAVGPGETLPGGCWDFDGNATNGAFWTSPSNAAIPDLGTGDFVILTFLRYGTPNTGGYVWSLRADANNAMTLRRFSDNNYYFQFKTGGVMRASVAVAESTLACHMPILMWREGTTFGIATYKAGGQTTATIVKATATISAGDTFDASIKQQSGARMRIGHNDGTTAGEKWSGAIGPVIFARDVVLANDTERLQLMLDPQRIFSYHNADAADVTAFGNWADSSGNLKESTKNEQFAANDRNVCPFTGNYLTISSSGHSGQLACPPYTMPAHPLPMQDAIGEWTYLASPQIIENPNGGWMMSRIQPNESGNPCYFVEFYGADGRQNRWPHLIHFLYYHVDSSASNAKEVVYNNVANVTNFGDTHVTMSMILAGGKLLCFPFGHSDIKTNAPASGDTTFSWAQMAVLTDAAVPSVLPQYTEADGALWGTAYSSQEAYTTGTKTYSLLNLVSSDRLLEASRAQSSQAGEIILCEITPSTNGIRRQRVIDNFGTNCRAYPGPIVALSDGRALMTGYTTHHASNYTIAQWGVIVPTAANWTDNSEWFTFDGTPMDGDGSNPTLGSVTLNNGVSTGLNMTTENASEFPSINASAVGFESIRVEQPIHITGSWEGVAAIVRVSDDNGDASRNISNSSGSVSQPWDRTEIRRWTYTSSGPSFSLRDTFDITSIIETLNPGTWPQNASYDTAEYQYLQAFQVGANKMLLLIIDPENVAVGTNLSTLSAHLGFTIRGALFYRMNASDPTRYVELVDVIYDIPTDNSEGYGLFPHYAGNGTDGQYSVGIQIAGGDWNTSYGNRVVRMVDLRTNLAASTPASGPQLIGGQLVGFPIVGQQIVRNKLVY